MQDSITAFVNLLAEKGTALAFPYSSGISDSRQEHMRELRIQHRGKPVRVFYAFDPRRSAILLIGGDKTGNDRFYEEYIPIVGDRIPNSTATYKYSQKRPFFKRGDQRHAQLLCHQ